VSDEEIDVGGCGERQLYGIDTFNCAILADSGKGFRSVDTERLYTDPPTSGAQWTEASPEPLQRSWRW
jgi:hypothetical protein